LIAALKKLGFISIPADTNPACVKNVLLFVMFNGLNNLERV